MKSLSPLPLCRSTWMVLLLAVLSAGFAMGETPRVYPEGQSPNDSRLGPLKNLNSYFPFDVPASRGEWEARQQQLQRQVLVATGLWPMPPKTPLRAKIYGKSERPDFTVEKVHFESLPGHFVTGLLFRPKNGSGPRPGVLCPHGHGGRLQAYGAGAMAKLIESGAEKFAKSGQYPKLARCANLARLGCTVFIFDMLGYADSIQISRQLAHGFRKQRPEFEGADQWGLFSCQAELRLQSIMGLQTWNSIRCLDFLASLPDVDSKRLGVTGGSGGGTQTILLGAIDDRPVVAFPNGMVSTAMQGGCTCENCSLLRVGTGNVELAALFAPRPQAMTAANDWTKEMMTKGYPELKQLYRMLGAPDRVYCREMLHFPHNYNYESRKTMYAWFNRYLDLGHDEPMDEVDFKPLTPAETTVWDKQHPAPSGDQIGDAYELKLTRQLAEISDQQLQALRPDDAASLQRFQDVVGGAFTTIVGRELPAGGDIQRTKIDKQEDAGFLFFKDTLRNMRHDEEFPVISLYPKSTEWNGHVVLWMDGRGKQGLFNEGTATPRAEIRRLIDGGYAVLGADLFQQGEFRPGGALQRQRVVGNPREFAGYTYAYNNTLLVRQAHDIMTLASFVANDEHAAKSIRLVGVNGAAPVAALASAVIGDTIDGLAVDTQGFRFRTLSDYRDPRFLPGAVKYGDLPSLLALSAPRPMWLGGENGDVPERIADAYRAADASPPASSSLQTTREAIVKWLMQ